jgi:hypothetical protein
MNTEIEILEAQKTPTIREWWTTVAALNCIITRTPNPTLHHIKSGSVGDIGAHSGWSQRGVSDYLVIPLRADLHVAGSCAIDGSIGVRTWETKFGTQVEMMDEVCRVTGFNAWAAAGIKRDPWASLISSPLTQE